MTTSGVPAYFPRPFSSQGGVSPAPRIAPSVVSPLYNPKRAVIITEGRAAACSNVKLSEIYQRPILLATSSSQDAVSEATIRTLAVTSAGTIEYCWKVACESTERP